jgi:hypothetical protein
VLAVHLPAADAVAPVHAPLQHWLFWLHASLICLHHDVAKLHLPPMHPKEQHSELAAQVLPAALHELLLPVTQTKPVQRPLQHWLPLAQVAPRFEHDGAPPSGRAWMHLPSAPQRPEQHWSFAEQVVVVSLMHGPLRLPHWFGAKMPPSWPVGHPPAVFPQG